jgi:hypothetical protein
MILKAFLFHVNNEKRWHTDYNCSDSDKKSKHLLHDRNRQVAK